MTAATMEAQYRLLSSLKEGDVFEHGFPFAFDPAEPLTWVCEEVAEVTHEGASTRRYTFHVYFRGVMLRSLVAYVEDAAKQVTWGGHTCAAS